MPHKYVQIEGVAVYLHHRGPTTLPEAAPDTTHGEVIVALHDAAANGAHFDPLLDALAERHSPLAFDQPGHARSGGLDSLRDVRAMAEFSLNVVRKLGLRPVVWLGEGLGAAVALEATRLAPDLARAVVACAPPDPGEIDPERIAALERVAAGKARRQFDPSGFAEGTPREVLGRAFGEWLKTDPRVAVGDWKALAAWDEADAAEALDLPTLVVVGEHGHRAAADRLAGRIPGSRRATLQGAGRHPVMEQPAALADAVCRFLVEALSDSDSDSGPGTSPTSPGGGPR